MERTLSFYIEYIKHILICQGHVYDGYIGNTSNIKKYVKNG